MRFPISGLILIPLTFGICCFSPYLLEWAIFSAVLQGAALVNVGHGFPVGLSTYFFVAGLVTMRVVPWWATGRIRFVADEPAVGHLQMLAIFIAWSAFSAFVLPMLFDGMLVDSPRTGIDRGYYIQAPLHWSLSNAGQAGYMVLNFVLILWLSQLATGPQRLERLLNAFSWSGAFVVAVGAYQLICNRMGLPFPSWFFNSNEAWAQAPNQMIGAGFSRISATFVEPSDAAGFFAAWSVFELSLAISGTQRNGWHWFLAMLGSAMLVETTSTTGYVTAGIMWLIMACDCALAIVRKGRIKVKASLTIIASAGVVLIALLMKPKASLLLDAVLFKKGQSLSALHRISTLGRAIDVFQHSWGLGAGLGSNRAMSVGFYILSNLGIPGLLLSALLLAQLYSQTWYRFKRPGIDPYTRAALCALGAALAANILALFVSGAEITQPRLWILWGLLLATIRRDWLIERQSSVYSFGGINQNRMVSEFQMR
jgi:hypothetical protein